MEKRRRKALVKGKLVNEHDVLLKIVPDGPFFEVFLRASKVREIVKKKNLRGLLKGLTREKIDDNIGRFVKGPKKKWAHYVGLRNLVTILSVLKMGRKWVKCGYLAGTIEKNGKTLRMGAMYPHYDVGLHFQGSGIASSARILLIKSIGKRKHLKNIKEMHGAPGKGAKKFIISFNTRLVNDAELRNALNIKKVIVKDWSVGDYIYKFK